MSNKLYKKVLLCRNQIARYCQVRSNLFKLSQRLEIAFESIGRSLVLKRLLRTSQ
jgi:hypothetical protein